MKIERTDFAYVRGALILLFGALLIAAAAAASSYFALQSAEKRYKISQNERTDIQGKLARANQEEAELRKKITRYQQLNDKGYFGAERRLDWIELLTAISNERRLSDFRYELSAQHPSPKSLLPTGVQAGGNQFMSSTLKFTAGVLHEGDLLSLLGDMRQRIPAYVTLRSCSLARTGIAARAGDNQPLLKTECELEWVTIQNPS